MLNLDLGNGAIATSLRLEDADAVHTLMCQNRAHLDTWLRWSSAIQTPDDARDLIDRFHAKETSGDGCHLGIWIEGQLAGGVVCWYIHRENKNAEVGYWLGSSFTGRGLATRSAKALIAHLFEEEGLHRVEMQCGVDNTASRAVAERCGLTLEGVRRGSHWITDRFVDHAIYGILATDGAEVER